MITIRRSHLEEFRKLVQTDYGDEARLVNAIRGREHPPTWQMRAGTAWHECLRLDIDRTECDGYCGVDGDYWFHPDDVQDGKALLGPGRWEVEGGRVFDVLGRQVRVTGTADHLHGLKIQDQKTCFSGIDAGHYEPALQWRFYLLIHGAQQFRYNCFAFKGPKKDGYCEFKEVQSFVFWTYPALLADCNLWLTRFVLWAETKDLLKHLERA